MTREEASNAIHAGKQLMVDETWGFSAYNGRILGVCADGCCDWDFESFDEFWDAMRGYEMTVNG